MITSMRDFLRYFDGVHRRALRDIGALPEAAERWQPPVGGGEGGWDIRQLVGHIAGSRLYLAHAYRDEGWLLDPWPGPLDTRSGWLTALDESMAQFRALMEDTPDVWLQRRIATIDTPGQALSGWRILMMMAEHEVHHRSQIDTYAGLNGWDVPQIYNRSAESIAAQRESQLQRQLTP